ncbi:hypothetical protein BJ741DRAFT_705860 [Chytriomyces cf. hyalinus JEL632]|nr:hypothetical protein BJ741DRAFT_705860 [Chytriomyces cf. hyalinus JEL632]
MTLLLLDETCPPCKAPVDFFLTSEQEHKLTHGEGINSNSNSEDQTPHLPGHYKDHTPFWRKEILIMDHSIDSTTLLPQDGEKPIKPPSRFRPHILLFTVVLSCGVGVTLLVTGFITGPTASHDNLHSQSLSLTKGNTQSIHNLASSTPEEVPAPNTTLACPKWETFNVKAQGDKDFSRNCRVVVAEVGGFEVTLCESMRECGQGYFLLKRLDKAQCDKAMARSISWDYEFDAWMKKEIGPDAFVITFSGPQRAAPSDWRHMGNCIYKHPFRLTNTGNYTVSIVHSHENFEAVQEKDRTWLRPVNNNLLVNWPMHICSSHCKPFTSDMIDKMTLPVCGRWHPTQGVYLRSVEGHMLEREKYKVENFHNPYYWHPLACKYDQLFELGSNSECHQKNHSVKFFGDSQVRVSWDITDRRLAGTREPLRNSGHDGVRQNYFHNDQSLNDFWDNGKEMAAPPDPSKHRTMIDFAGRDGYLLWFTSEYVTNPDYWRLGDPALPYPETNRIDRKLREFDSVLFNVAMWPMSGVRDGGQYSAGRFKAMFSWIVETMMEMNHRRGSMNVGPINFIWHGVSSYPLTRTQDINDDTPIRKDWRSPYRLKIWSDLAENILTPSVQLATSIRRVDTFEMTHPFIHEAPDTAHYFTTPAVEAETDDILHKLNLCERP